MHGSRRVNDPTLQIALAKVQSMQGLRASVVAVGVSALAREMPCRRFSLAALLPSGCWKTLLKPSLRTPTLLVDHKTWTNSKTSPTLIFRCTPQHCLSGFYQRDHASDTTTPAAFTGGCKAKARQDATRVRRVGSFGLYELRQALTQRIPCRLPLGACLRSVGLNAPQFSQRPLDVAHARKNSPTAALVASTVSDVSRPRRGPGPRPTPDPALAPRRAAVRRPSAPTEAARALGGGSPSAACLAASCAAAAHPPHHLHVRYAQGGEHVLTGATGSQIATMHAWYHSLPAGQCKRPAHACKHESRQAHAAERHSTRLGKRPIGRRRTFLLLQ